MSALFDTTGVVGGLSHANPTQSEPTTQHNQPTSYDCLGWDPQPLTKPPAHTDTQAVQHGERTYDDKEDSLS
mgnify:CR=1 FL=1